MAIHRAVRREFCSRLHRMKWSGPWTYGRPGHGAALLALVTSPNGTRGVGLLQDGRGTGREEWRAACGLNPEPKDSRPAVRLVLDSAH